MPSLAEVQSQIRAAVVQGSTAELTVPLVGGRYPLERLRVHQRHYQASLLEVLLRRFPATQWLLGTPRVMQAAREFVRNRAPATPCVAEYGAEFPAFLASRIENRLIPGLRWFGELEWRLGEVTLCVDYPARSTEVLADVEPDALPPVVIRLQPGLRFLEAPWPVDALMELFLAERAPDQYVLQEERICLQIRGARGGFGIERLQEGAFAFRRALAEGQTAELAAERALNVEPDFDIGRALCCLVAEGLVSGFELSGSGLVL